MPGENCVEIGIHDGGDFAKGHTSKVMEIHNPGISVIHSFKSGIELLQPFLLNQLILGRDPRAER